VGAWSCVWRRAKRLNPKRQEPPWLPTNIPDGTKAKQLRNSISSALALLSAITSEAHSRRP
jgi:hypothetical protein